MFASQTCYQILRTHNDDENRNLQIIRFHAFKMKTQPCENRPSSTPKSQKHCAGSTYTRLNLDLSLIECNFAEHLSRNGAVEIRILIRLRRCKCFYNSVRFTYARITTFHLPVWFTSTWLPFRCGSIVKTNNLFPNLYFISDTNCFVQADPEYKRKVRHLEVIWYMFRFHRRQSRLIGCDWLSEITCGWLADLIGQFGKLFSGQVNGYTWNFLSPYCKGDIFCGQEVVPMFKNL